MTTFAELESLVIEQTRRPEISSVTKAAIRTATLRAHHTDFFPRDLARVERRHHGLDDGGRDLDRVNPALGHEWPRRDAA